VSTWLVAWFVIGAVTTVAMIASFVALARHAVVLGRSAKRMQEEAQPIVADINRLTARQSAHIEELRHKVPAGKRRSREP
jgi:hypothetical protein